MAVYIFRSHSDDKYFKVGKAKDVRKRLSHALTYKNDCYIAEENINDYGDAFDNSLEAFLHSELVLNDYRDYRKGPSSDKEVFYDTDGILFQLLVWKVREFGYLNDLPVHNLTWDLDLPEIYRLMREAREKANAWQLRSNLLRQHLLDASHSDKSLASNGFSVKTRTIHKVDLKRLRDDYPEVADECSREIETTTVKLTHPDLIEP